MIAPRITYNGDNAYLELQTTKPLSIQYQHNYDHLPIHGHKQATATENPNHPYLSESFSLLLNAQYRKTEYNTQNSQWETIIEAPANEQVAKTPIIKNIQDKPISIQYITITIHSHSHFSFTNTALKNSPVHLLV